MTNTTIVTCIEAGRLEWLALMLISSLRSFDGTLSRAPVLVIQPRRGPSIHPKTRKALATLDAQYVKEDIVGPYNFHGTLNKSAALSWAEAQADTDYLTWLDGDTVLVRDPDGLLPSQDVDFNATPGEDDLGTDGKDGTAQFWAETSARFGVDHLTANKIASEPNGAPIYEYYHGGVFSFRSGLGLAAAHFDFTKRLIDMRLSSKVTGTFHHDQMAMTYAALKCAPRRAVLDQNYNRPISIKSTPDVVAAAFDQAHVLHYHNCFEPAHAATFKPYFDRIPAPQRAILEKYVPVQYETRMLSRLWTKALTLRRRAKHAAHEKHCEIV